VFIATCIEKQCTRPLKLDFKSQFLNLYFLELKKIKSFTEMQF